MADGSASAAKNKKCRRPFICSSPVQSQQSNSKGCSTTEIAAMSRHERSSPSCAAIPPQIRRQCNFTPGFKPTNRSDAGTDQRRAAKCFKNAAFPGWLAGHCLVDYSPKSRGVSSVLCQASGQRSDEVAVAVEPQNLEPGHPPLPETLPIILDRALQRCIAHYRPARLNPVIYPILA